MNRPREPLSQPEVRGFAALAARMAASVNAVLLGKPEVVRLTFTALFAQGHVLLEDVPGVGKTTLARAVAATIGGRWQRIRFTPDLLPSDVLGVDGYDATGRAVEFYPGPVFANVVIADEIDRAAPKTRSALLDVMAEHAVTVDGVRHLVPEPFLVVATRDPAGPDGTHGSSEARPDRFLVRLSVGYPDEAAEVEVVRGAGVRSPDALPPVTDTDTVGEMIRMVRRVHIAEPLYGYAVRLAAATRTHPQVRVGASPRAVIGLTRTACAYALVDGRGWIMPEDLKALVEPVFAHRLLLTPEALVRGVTAADVLRQAVASVPVPHPSDRPTPAHR